MTNTDKAIAELDKLHAELEQFTGSTRTVV